MVLVFWLKARTEDAARKAATARLANGTGYLPETATVRAVWACLMRKSPADLGIAVAGVVIESAKAPQLFLAQFR
jgi:hypothetical protein